MQNFWHNLPRPFLALAPMEDVTDTVFRELVMGISEPECLHVVFTEFTSTDGLCHEKGREKVSERLLVNPSERELLERTDTRLVAQIWGSDPEMFYRASRMIVSERTFDGIDINMGCPVKKVMKQGACAALIREPALAKEIIRATIEGSGLPVSVKTRIGFDRIVTEEWVGHLFETEISALTIHGRIQKVDSEGPVHWEEIEKASLLRHRHRPDLVLIGNGDVDSVEEAHSRCLQHGTDGIMIGKGVFRNPWVFNRNQIDRSPAMKLNLLLRHINLFSSTWENGKHFDVLKRFFKIYTSGFPGAAHLRNELMMTGSVQEVKDAVKACLNHGEQRFY